MTEMPIGNENETEMENLVDFDLEDEYKPAPLIPDGSFPGAITGATFNGVQLSIKTCFNETNALMSDGETSVDGATLSYNVWFPKAGDDQVLIKSGTMTKKQWKINNAKEVSQALGISLNTRTVIKEAIENGDWIGIPIIAKVATKEYQGNISNEITQIVRNNEAAV